MNVSFIFQKVKKNQNKQQKTGHNLYQGMKNDMQNRTEHLHYKFKYEEADYTLYRDAQNGQAEEQDNLFFTI